MAPQPRTWWVVWLRRAVQTAFLLLFLYLFLETRDHPIDAPGRGVTLFFRLDPLAMVSVWLASHAVATGMLLSLATLGVTLVFGRWFCGWVCPLGSLHHFFSSLRRGRVAEHLAKGAFSRWQKAKYYALAAFLGGALLGANLAGWLDPFSFFFRSLGTAVYPALNAAAVRFFGWIYDANPGIGPVRATAVSEPAYQFLRRHVLAIHQPHYFGNALIGFLFIAVVALNFFRARFWCRYICPLGALLAVVGKNPAVRLKRSAAACNDCRLCLADCQGGANPHTGEWKPAECFYCFNCKSACPNAALALGVGVEDSRPAGQIQGAPQ